MTQKCLDGHLKFSEFPDSDRLVSGGGRNPVLVFIEIGAENLLLVSSNSRDLLIWRPQVPDLGGKVK